MVRRALKPSLTFLKDKSQVLALAHTAKASNRPCSSLLGIQDESVALAFDMECAEVLFEFEQERELQRFELLTGATVSRVMTGAVQTSKTVNEGSF